MHRSRKWLAAAALSSLALLGAPSPSFARTPTKVEWTHIRVPEGKEADRTTKLLKTLLTQAAKKADFGKAKNVKLSARVVQFSSERRGDVLQVSCTIVGRLVGGPTARSRISFGGDPAEREKLEKQVLSMVANGLVARLADIARTQAAKAEKAAKAEAAANDGKE